MHAEKCPICNGNGLVPHGFYNQTSGHWSASSTEPEKCRSCDGKGYVLVGEPVAVKPVCPYGQWFEGPNVDPWLPVFTWESATNDPPPSYVLSDEEAADAGHPRDSTQASITWRF